MRPLLLLASAIVLVDTMLYAALVPLLPEYADEYGLSKGAAGMLVSAYAAGALLGALPGGLVAARVGPKHAVLAGLALMSCASVGFGLAPDVWLLGLARLGQGFGSSLSWGGALTWLIAAAPRRRRGEVLGTAVGAAVFGALLGPVLGSVAGAVGTARAFAAVAALGGMLFVWTLRTPGAATQPDPIRALPAALRDRRFLGGLWLVLLPALLFGVLAVLGPLRLASFGWGATAIGALFLVGASLEALANPLVGRFSDRRGRLLPVRMALLASAAASVALATVAEPAFVAAAIVAAAVSYGGFYAPGMALLSDGADSAGLAQGLAFGLMNAAWALGNVVGPAAGGALAGIAGDALPYLLLTVICLATLAGTRHSGRPLVTSPASRAQS